MQTLTLARKSILVAALVFLTTLVRAQTDIKVDINKGGGGGGGWYANPIVWIVGAAIFILLLVALLRGGRKD